MAPPRPSQSASMEDYEAAWRVWFEQKNEAVAAYAERTSLVELPGNLECHAEVWNFDEHLFTRDEGLEVVAKVNRRAIDAAASEGRRVCGSTGVMMVELGERLPNPSVSLDLEHDGLGKECRDIQLPIRLVRPTADELAAYAV